MFTEGAHPFRMRSSCKVRQDRTTRTTKARRCNCLYVDGRRRDVLFRYFKNTAAKERLIILNAGENHAA